MRGQHSSRCRGHPNRHRDRFLPAQQSRVDELPLGQEFEVLRRQSEQTRSLQPNADVIEIGLQAQRNPPLGQRVAICTIGRLLGRNLLQQTTRRDDPSEGVGHPDQWDGRVARHLGEAFDVYLDGRDSTRIRGPAPTLGFDERLAAVVPSQEMEVLGQDQLGIPLLTGLAQLPAHVAPRSDEDREPGRWIGLVLRIAVPAHAAQHHPSSIVVTVVTSGLRIGVRQIDDRRFLVGVAVQAHVDANAVDPGQIPEREPIRSTPVAGESMMPGSDHQILVERVGATRPSLTHHVLHQTLLGLVDHLLVDRRTIPVLVDVVRRRPADDDAAQFLDSVVAPGLLVWTEGREMRGRSAVERPLAIRPSRGERLCLVPGVCSGDVGALDG